MLTDGVAVVAADQAVQLALRVLIEAVEFLAAPGQRFGQLPRRSPWPHRPGTFHSITPPHTGLRLGRRLGGRGSGGWREELQGDSVRVAEGDTRAVVGVFDSAVRDAKLVQARRPCLQLVAVAAGEGNVIKASAVLVEGVTGGLVVGMQAE